MKQRKKMLRVIMIFILLCIGAETSSAQSLGSIFRSVTGLGGEVVSWSNPDDMTPDEYINRYFTRVAHIPNAGAEAYSIRCNSGGCRVEYTTERAARIAYRRFVSMLSSQQRGVFKKRNVLVMNSCNIVEYNENPENEVLLYTPEQVPSGSVVRERLLAEAKGWNSYVAMKLVDRDYWRVTAPLMKAHFTPIESEAYFAFDELDELATAAQKVGLSLILELDLRDVSRFENAVGHSVQSQVGEMVVAKIVDDMLKRISIAKIRVILPQSRYTAKISDIRHERFELILK